MLAALGRIEHAIVADLARGEAVAADGVRFLLRLYESAARDDLDETIGRALAIALASDMSNAASDSRAASVELFVDAMALSNDERLVGAAVALAPALRSAWSSPRVHEACTAISACLYASALPAYDGLMSDAIDELERIVARKYEPGERLGNHADQVCAASALLTAFDLSGRLPYPMLAEELIQSVRRGGDVAFEDACRAARVLCRVARLHDDAEYRATAVIAPAADYRADARRLLRLNADEAVRRGSAGAIYALALLELESAHNSDF